ncbi:hypothetical protein [Mycolicibacterium moriokaense]|uniref:Uncharacterized protein n=1 Tax=Mycolicibacterium moriokaense TaxID=39691 RepID=A0A318H885_9MYCO|nr:hypothetical protein [Mycolicibacterium moriokaense]PXX01665.1 hypothetical protein C8E89_12759 [Mycolicibacterium moriokaense]
MEEHDIPKPTLLDDTEEVLGEPSFELLIKDGVPVVSGSYFIQPPLSAVSAEWDAAHENRLNVRANDGSEWIADNVPRSGRVSVVLHPVDGVHPAYATKAL